MSTIPDSSTITILTKADPMASESKKLSRRRDSRQIPLVLPLEPALSRDDLLESPANRLAVDLVDRWPDWPSNTIVLAGPVGAGKTHLARIWAQNSGARIISMRDIGQLEEAGAGESLVLEDVSSDSIDQEALFHAFNRARSHSNYIFMTSREFPSAWQITLADLASRLKLAHIVELHEPDDELLAGIIVKLFADRQLQVDPSLVAYLVPRMERSMETATLIVEWMDKQALAQRRKINRSLAADALEALGQT